MTTPDNSQPPQYTPPPAPEPGSAYGTSAAPAYGSGAPAYGASGQAPSGPVPGKTLGIVALIVAFFFNLIGLILGIVALVQSRKAGVRNLPAVWAIIIGALSIVIGLIVVFAFVIPAVTFGVEAAQACQAANFAGTVVVRGVEVDCASIDG
ncbi:DUF4190 domain-containing protein [Microbacterium sp. P02]|uniref:DUF4190 domain-containing protein n=1 Tax=Microbacterium sp. P02 TaxID=3366260 RepID=UPI00366C7BCC